MKYIIGIILGIIISISSMATAGWLSSGIGGAAGAALATSGIEGKVDTINSRIDVLVRALDSVKVCK